MKFRAALILGAVVVTAGTCIAQLPKPAPDGAASGPIAEIFAEAVDTRSTDRLTQHARSVPGTKICVVSVQRSLRWAARSGGASDAGVPNYALGENVWALMLIRPEKPAEYTTESSARVSPQHSLACVRVEDAKMRFSEATRNGPTKGYFTLTTVPKP